jgi:hypothetical protein
MRRAEFYRYGWSKAITNAGHVPEGGQIRTVAGLSH